MSVTHAAATESPKNTTSNHSDDEKSNRSSDSSADDDEISNRSSGSSADHKKEISNRSSDSSADDDEIMDRELLKACRNDDLVLFRALVDRDPNVLMSVTPVRNNCLHLAAMLGYHELAKEVWSRDASLFSSTNKDGETPLVLAVASANNTLASDMIAAATKHLQPDSTHGMEGGKPLNEMLLKVDKRGDNVLHHAMRNGLEYLAAQLLDIEPQLSEQVNNTGESPMYMAARKGYSIVLERLLSIPSSAECGPLGCPPLHAAIQTGRTDIIKQILEARPKQAYRISATGLTPLGTAVTGGNLKIVKMLLQHDPNLAHVGRPSEKGVSYPFLLAAVYGLVPIAEEISRVCPDAAYACDALGLNALHLAVHQEHMDFVNYIIRTPEFHKLINQAKDDGDLPLHMAASSCNPDLLRALLNNKQLDHTAVNKFHANVVDRLSDMAGLTRVSNNTGLSKTLKWNESYTLVSNSIPHAWRKVRIHQAKRSVKRQAIREVKSLTKRYTTNTSLVAALLATITFAAAFTLPGGYSSDGTSDAGQPIFGMKAAFQVFLISDTIAMCSSLAVAFLCVLATWEDLDYLLNYRKTTRALMWCAYTTTAVAFGTGLFTVMAPKCMWLAILILVLTGILPFASKIIGDWPLLMLRLRLGRLYQKELVPNI